VRRKVAGESELLQSLWQGGDWRDTRLPAPEPSPGTCAAAGDSLVCSFALHVLGGVILVILANTLFLHLHDMGAPEAPTAFLHPLLTFVGFFVLAKAAAGFAAGWGLLQREPWARVLALILAFLDLINVPFGTALGVYTLWVLLPAQSEEDYEKYLGAAA